MKELDIDNTKHILMAMSARNAITPEEYADFLRNYSMDYIKWFLDGPSEEEEVEENTIVFAEDASKLTLKLKIKLQNVAKPPMWREVLVPADFNFSQLHYVIQAAVGLNDCHLWQFGRKAYDNNLVIGIPRKDIYSFGIDGCTYHADETPLIAFLAEKGDKLVYTYDFRLDWIFDISVVDVLERQEEVAECRKYKSDLQAIDGIRPYLYCFLREFQKDPAGADKADIKAAMSALWLSDEEKLRAIVDDHLIDLEFVNDELAIIPDCCEKFD